MRALWNSIVSRFFLPIKKDPFYSEIARCAVKISVDKNFATGFFVGPNCILTCAHTFSKDKVYDFSSINVQCKDLSFEIEGMEFLRNISEEKTPYPDVVFLKTKLAYQYYVDIERGRLPLGQSYYTFGFPDSFKGGDSHLLTYEGPTWLDQLQQMQLHKFTDSQIISGLSGSPVVWIDTGRVMGMIQSSRDFYLPLGGRAIPVDILDTSIKSCKGMAKGNDLISKAFQIFNKKREMLITEYTDANNTLLNKLINFFSIKPFDNTKITFHFLLNSRNSNEEFQQSKTSRLLFKLEQIGGSFSINRTQRKLVFKTERNRKNIKRIVDLGLSGELNSFGVTSVSLFQITRTSLVNGCMTFIMVATIYFCYHTTLRDIFSYQDKQLPAKTETETENIYPPVQPVESFEIEFRDITQSGRSITIDGTRYKVDESKRNEILKLMIVRRSLLKKFRIIFSSLSFEKTSSANVKVKWYIFIHWADQIQKQELVNLQSELHKNADKIVQVLDDSVPKDSSAS